MRTTVVLALFTWTGLAALTWVNTGDLTGAKMVRDLSIGPSGQLYAAASIDTGPATYSATAFRSADLFNWQPVNVIPGQVQVITTLAKSGGDTLFAATRATGSGTYGAWLYYSADGGNWSYRARMFGLRVGNTMTALLIDNLGRFHAGSDYMGMSAALPQYSNDRGTNWTAGNIPFNADHQFLFQASDNSLFLGTGVSGRAWKSTDNGLNWSFSTTNSGVKSSMAEGPAGRLYLSERNTTSTAGWVYLSTNTGSSWTTVLATRPVFSLCRASDGNVYAGVGYPGSGPDSGEVLVSLDNGLNWQSAGRLPGSTRVYKLLDVNVSGTHYLYAATGPYGDVFRAQLTGGPMHDVGVTNIGAPTGTIDSTSLVTPACSVFNYGSQAESYQVRMRVGSFYDQTAPVSGHPAGSRLFVQFPPCSTWLRGVHTVSCSTELSGDMDTSNDKETGTLTVQVRDVGVALILAPVSMVDSGTTIAPACSVYNYGTSTESYRVRMRIGSGYNDTASVAGHAPGTWRYLAFPDWTAAPRGQLAVACSTELATDMNNSNDKKTDGVLVRVLDVGAISIIAPSGSHTRGQVVTPTATWHNYGNTPADFEAWMLLTDPIDARVYAKKVDVAGLLPGLDTTVNAFPSCTLATIGTWSARCSTFLAADMNQANDWLDRQFTVTALWPFGWVEVRPLPTGIPIKDGGWLAVNQGNGLIYCCKGNKSNEFCAYEPIGDTYTTLAAIPAGAKPPKKGCDGVADGSNYVYMTKGNNTFEFWRYDISANVWESLPPVPVGTRGKGCKKGTDMAFVGSGEQRTGRIGPSSMRPDSGSRTGSSLGHLVTGSLGHSPGFVYLLKGYGTEFYRFDVSANAWEPALPDVPAGAKPKVDEGSWLCFDQASKLYFLKAKYDELWPYDLGTGIWGSQLPPMPLVGMTGKRKKPKDGGAGAWYDSSIYALKGGNTQEFWKYTPGDSWRELDTMPAVGSTGKKKRVKTGGDIVHWGAGALFATKGNKTLEMWRYIEPPTANSLQLTADRSGVMSDKPSATGHCPLAIYPNPLTSGYLTLRYSTPIPGRTRVSVYDESGRLVQSAIWNLQSGMVLDLRRLPSGVYIVEFAAGGFRQTEKLVLQR